MSRTPGFRAKKRDANEAEIVKALRSQEYIVVRLDDPFDLIVQCPDFGCWHAMEVKNPDGKNQLTENQLEDFARMHHPPSVVRSVEDARNAIVHDHDVVFP